MPIDSPLGSGTSAVWKSAADAVVAGDAATLERLLREHEAMFRAGRPEPAWSNGLTPEYSAGDARSIIVRTHFFDNWDRFAAYAAALQEPTSAVARFEAAVDAIVDGDAASLQDALRQTPELIRARSTRTHHSTLLHYAGANGVEGFRQRTPPNAAEIAEMLLKAGADVDAVADMYGGGCTTLGLVATSIHPKVAGVLHPLIDVLLAHGAGLHAQGAGRAYPLVNGCLANGRGDAAEYLASRGAPLDLEAAAGVGRLDLVRSFFTTDGNLRDPATAPQMRDGFTWACEYGRTEVVEYLLDHGIDAGQRFERPFGQTGLHWAAHGGHVSTVQALLKRGAPADVRDEEFHATPLGWALHGWNEQGRDAARNDGFYAAVRLLVAAGAPVEPQWLTGDSARADPRLVAALTGQKSDS